MESLLRPAPLPPATLKLINPCYKTTIFSQNSNFRLVSGNGHSCFLPFSSFKSKKSAIFAATKKDPNPNNNKKKKKSDSHSYVPRPDEATGPFPEAVLLREKKVEEDGKLLPEFADVDERELFETLMLELESDLDIENSRHYEVVYLIHEDYKEEVESVNQKIQEFIKEKKGRVWRMSDWGMRRLAYKIQKAKNAHYMLMNLEVEAKWINEFKIMLDKDERIIRHLVMKMDKAETKDCPPPPEFHTLRSDMDDDDDEDEEDEDDLELEYDDDEEDGEDESETETTGRTVGEVKHKAVV